ncbi:RES family NAD+ phosphorylase [Paraburkholderia humisilvae]|uniref:RES family NAD+ phosphorylase n=1 Tax=Paraburkholderia humisilvae TaxID=627669 RepID=UPI0035ED4836
MTVSVWRIGTDAPNYTADDMTGEGARQTGGRWNRAGTPVIYAATNISLACLETLAHLSGDDDLPLNRYLVRVDIPDDTWANALVYTPDKAPVGWDAIPTGKVSLDAGAAWVGEKKGPALMRVPSVIVPEEANVIINPAHSDATQLKATKVRKWTYDSRIKT